MRLILRAHLPCTCCGIRYLRIVRLLFFLRKWRMFCERMSTLPVAVTLNLLATPDRVFCLCNAFILFLAWQ